MDTSPDLLLCCLLTRPGRTPDQAATTKKLLTEIRNRSITAKYWNYIREFPIPPFSAFVHGIAVWFTSNDAATELYKSLHAWLELNPDGQVEVTINKTLPTGRPLRQSDIQFDVTDMTEEQFLALFRQAAS